MQRKKTREELVNEPYLNPAQISRLLGVDIRKANKLYEKANEIDDQLDFRVEERKVRQKTVLKVAGLTHEDLKKMVA